MHPSSGEKRIFHFMHKARLGAQKSNSFSNTQPETRGVKPQNYINVMLLSMDSYIKAPDIQWEHLLVIEKSLVDWKSAE